MLCALPKLETGAGSVRGPDPADPVRAAGPSAESGSADHLH